MVQAGSLRYLARQPCLFGIHERVGDQQEQDDEGAFHHITGARPSRLCGQQASRLRFRNRQAGRISAAQAKMPLFRSRRLRLA